LINVILLTVAAYDVVDILYFYVLQMFSSIITVSSSWYAVTAKMGNYGFSFCYQWITIFLHSR